VTPLRLAPNLVDHFYAGGKRIAALRGITTTASHQPEEWLGSTVPRAHDNVVGLSVTEDGRLLRDLVAADPGGWRGTGPWPGIADHDTGLLLKLLDAGQRLPVHVHPDRAFAASHLACPYGKTEAWYVLDVEPGAAVHLGWTEDVDRDELVRRIDAQDGEWMLSRMHRLEVRPGDGILVPAGQVHAIGAGIFVAEVQEPTDFSILLEWSVTTSTREESHLGLGFERALSAVSHRALEPATLARLVRQAGGTVGDGPRPCLPAEADRYFRLHRAQSGDLVAAGFAVLLVLEGAALVTSGAGLEVRVAQGEAWAVPHGFGDWSVSAQGALLVARPGAGWPADLGVAP
jgi:mannose-6-phosphate isomerase